MDCEPKTVAFHADMQQQTETHTPAQGYFLQL